MSLEKSLILPAFLLQVASAVAITAKLFDSSYNWTNENYKASRSLKWYVAHIVLCIAHQLIWGLPLVKATRRWPGSKLPVVLYLISAFFSGFVTAVPLLRLSKQRQILGFGVYASSVAYIILFTVSFLYLLLRINTVARPKDHYSEIMLRSYLGKLEGFQWFAGYQLAAYWPRALLIEVPVVNAMLSWVLLFWHMLIAAYVGSHKPRWKTARGINH